MRCRSLLIAAAPLALIVQLATAAEETKQQPADPTPPPLGTASFTPPPAVEEEPLTANTFVVRAAVANMAEVELGQLAAARSTDPKVQAFARKMVEQHGQSLQQLRAAAADAKIALPATVDEKHRELKQSLSSLQGEEFDAAYAKAMAKGHDEAVALFDAAAHASKLPESLRAYAAKALPVVRQHRDGAQELHASEAD